MLTLTHGCSCDVCAEEYGPHRLPHSIPCGHVLCASCCTTIIDKTSSRLSPVCPFCREQFTSDSVRLIRMDFTTSGWSTPRRFPTVEASHDFTGEFLARRTEQRLLATDLGMSRNRLEARRLEDKVAKVAAKKCSVEEVSALHKELEGWLLSEKDDQTSSLYLSAALLRAILMNHMAHSEASRNSKNIESGLKNKVEDLENNNEKLETELRRQRTQYTQKAQECQQLRTEISQLKALATTLGISHNELPPHSPTGGGGVAAIPQSPTPPSTSPVPPYPPTSHSHLSRFNSVHSRSASMSSRPSTPAATPMTPSRSHTPAISSPPRSHTPSLRSTTPSLRSTTPSLRSYTPAPSSMSPPPVPSIPTRYAATPSPMQQQQHQQHQQMRTQTPAPLPPLIPPKPRRLSQPSPPKMMRSTSEEKAEAHERWIPPEMVADYDKGSYKPSRPSSRMGFGLSAAAARFRDMRSNTPAPP